MSSGKVVMRGEVHPTIIKTHFPCFQRSFSEDLKSRICYNDGAACGAGNQ